MTGETYRFRKISDEQVTDILLAGPDVSNAELAKAIGCSAWAIYVIRAHRSWRAIKAAKALGLIPLSPRRRVFTKGGGELTVSATEARRCGVAGRAA